MHNLTDVSKTNYTFVLTFVSRIDDDITFFTDIELWTIIIYVHKPSKTPVMMLLHIFALSFNVANLILSKK